MALNQPRDDRIVGEDAAALPQNFSHFREVSLSTVHCTQREVDSRSGIGIVALNELKMLPGFIKTTVRSSNLAKLEVTGIAIEILFDASAQRPHR